MTEDDLWTETAIQNAEYGKYYDTFEAKMDEWSAALAVSRNEASFKRYDPYEYPFLIKKHSFGKHLHRVMAFIL